MIPFKLHGRSFRGKYSFEYSESPSNLISHFVS